MHQWSEDKIERWVREGRGQGSGSQYRPWLTVHDLSSRGRCHRAWCDKVGRQLELFSDTEYGAFLIAERSPRVVDIQKQFPLDRELSQSCARALGIRHPTYPGTHVPTVLTVDLLVTVQAQTGVIKIGIDCKVKTDAEDRRTLEKLDLARVCLEQRGYRHVLVFDAQLPKQLIRNLDFIRAARPHPQEVLPYPDYLDDAVHRFHQNLSRLLFGKKPLHVVCTEFDRAMGWQPKYFPASRSALCASSASVIPASPPARSAAARPTLCRRSTKSASNWRKD